MRVGILTYHWVANYGANLQALSTYCCLEKKGLNPIIINWVPNDAWTDYLNSSANNQIDVHNNFIKRHCKLTRRFSEQKDVEKIIIEEGITHIIIGSDALFNIIKPHFHPLKMKFSKPSSDHIFPNLYWGKYIENVPHVGLSISSQNSRYFEFFFNKNEVSKLLSKFSAITVRDDWAKNLVEFFTNKKISPNITPDPVFSFNANVSNNITKGDVLRKYDLSQNYVLVSFDSNPRYAVEPSWLEELKELFQNKGIKIVNMPRPSGGQRLHNIKEITMPIDPLDWYSLIKYSYAYIGILMHPIVVCLHNAVPFYSIDGYGIKIGPYINIESSKVFNILRKAELLDNYYSQLKNNGVFPAAKEVFDKVCSFPKKKCQIFSEKMERECLENYNNLIDTLINKK